MKPGGLAFAILIALPSAAAAADEEPICADRPGAANPSCTVPPGRVQVETGSVDWTRDRSAGVRSTELEAGATAFKLGLTDRLHVELDVTPFVRVRTSEGGVRTTASGFGDSAIALKYRLTGESAPVGIALYPFVKLPTAKRPLGNGKVEGGAALLVDGTFPSSAVGWNIAPELDIVADSDGFGHHLAMVQVASVSLPLSGRVSLSGDLSGVWDWDPAGRSKAFVAGVSAAWLVSNDLQLDAGAALGLDRDSPDVQLYSGIAVRF